MSFTALVITTSEGNSENMTSWGHSRTGVEKHRIKGSSLLRYRNVTAETSLLSKYTDD